MVAWSSYGLDLKDYLIFLSHERDPSLSNVAISREVSETEPISSESVRIRKQRMKESGFLRPDRTIEDPVLGERTQTEVEAVYSPHRLGLLRQHVLFVDVPGRSALDELKILCDAHPYTHFRTIGYSSGATLYAQFDIPPDAKEVMTNLYAELENRNLFREFHLYDTQSLAKHEADFGKWNLVENKWSVEYGTKSRRGDRLSRIESLWSEFQGSYENEPLEPCGPEMAFNFDELDLALVRELTINGRPDIKPLGPIYDRDPTTISRRVKRLRETVVTEDMLYYDRSVFDLTYPQLMTGDFSRDDELDANSLYWFIRSGGIPFETKASIEDNSFVLFITTPPSVAPEVSEFLWEHTANLDVFQLQLDASFTYFFYHKNYLGDGEWRTDDNYVIDEPLAELT
ncbi:Lrp/AsnC family transcriptional regulator [Candidatus Thorarchaeota archaeon]|nr:MAG: Lrp/AsnC family transcriptional regulator [Candidatus Thorarchaeota archaeon]